MRSTYEERYGIGTDNEIANKYNGSHHNNNRYYNNHNNNHSSAIPYHAREYSLPFSYGQIGKTSTPLRNVNRANGSDRSFLDNGANEINYNLNYNYNNNNTNHTFKNGSNTGRDEIDNMLKTQPRLTSPLLVRKTLNSSRSPTRNNTNATNTQTIANTYHYNYGVNGSGGQQQTTRNDFEELLRERREKVYNEYRQQQQQQKQHNLPPEPPQRQHLPSTLLSTGAINGNNNIYNRYNNGKTAATSGKYNYDFEFNLNLDDFEDLRPRTEPTSTNAYRPHTMERSTFHQQQLQQWEREREQQRERERTQYRTRDIPDAPLHSQETYVERNYHTISSSNPNRETSMVYPPPQTSTTTTNERPPLEVAYKRHLQQQQQQQQLQSPIATYGNGNASGYGNNSYNNNNEYGFRGSLGATTTTATTSRSRRDLSPIYATTTKQQMVRSISSNSNNIGNRSNNNNNNEPDYPFSSPSSATIRPETPAFPVTPRQPYGANNGFNTPIITTHSPTPPRNGATEMQNYNINETIYQTNNSSNSNDYRTRLNSSLSVVSTNTEPQEVAAHLVKFARNSAKFWYKPNLSREDAIALLLNAPPGTFVVRDSTTYKNAYGLVLRVAQPPPGSSSGKLDELVRHFLIEPTTRGVRLKGCANEPVFTSLSALVYEHSINQLALPCLLGIPEHDIVQPLVEPTAAQQQLLTQGAACNVLWLFSCETESLTGIEAIRKAIRQLYALKPAPAHTEVHFKVTQQGITLTDPTRKKFFRKHYCADIISYIAIDPENRLWSIEDAASPPNSEAAKSANNVVVVGALKKTIFAFVARRSPSSKDNQCHVFCDLAISQPASAIVAFANRTLPTEKQRNYVL